MKSFCQLKGRSFFLMAVPDITEMKKHDILCKRRRKYHMKFENAKVLVADIDGTIVTKGEVPGPLTIEAMKMLHAHGVQLGIASGRVINDSLKGRHKEWNLPFQFDVLIGMNGGQVLLTKTGELYEQYALSTDTLREVMTWMKPLGLIASIYEGNHMVATAIDEMQCKAQSYGDHRQPWRY